jgi:glycosyltransferase involved in cell wall biosynthesis
MQQTKPKLAHIITRMDWGGSPDIVRMLCEHTCSQYDITIVTGQNNFTSAQTKDFLDSFKGQVISISQLRREINPFWDICALIRLIKIMREKKFDIVHTHTSKAGFIGRIAAKICRVKKIVHTPHGHIFYGYFPKIFSQVFATLERIAARFSNKIIALTCLEKNDMLHFKIADSKKIKVIASGLKEDSLQKLTAEKKSQIRNALGINDDDIAVGMVSRLEEVKGGRHFIAAAAKIKMPNVKFIIAGEGKQRLSLTELAKKLNVNINFLGWRSDALEIIEALDILVQPSLNEAFALTILQANFLKTPVIASRTGGIPEVITDGVTGMLVPVGDSEKIALAITQLCNAPAERKRLAQNAYAQAQSYFTCEKMVNAICEVYQE